MRMKPALPILGLAILLAASLACSLGAAGTSAPTSAPALPTQTQAAAGIDVSYQGTSFTIPQGLASGASTEQTSDVELPFTNPGGGDLPAHLKFTLEHYSGPAATAYLAVFPAEAYAQYAQMTADNIAALKNLPDSLDTLDQNSPLLQYSFYAKARVVPFQNGRGLRYLTQVMQAILPINNAEMFYWYSGLTSDGKYYVSAAFPVSANMLQASGGPDSAVPPGGVPFQDSFDAAQATQYYDQVQQKLNEAGPGAFSPSLESLDALIQSLKVSAP